MKEKNRWRSEEDALLLAYVKQYGPREWNLVSQRMNTAFSRDTKSCLERWKNYLKPGIKKGPLTEEEQHLVISLQAKYGNKWKKIASEVPGRTAKRLGKWWEVFKEKQQRIHKENNKTFEPIEEGKYNRLLETFAEKLIKDCPVSAYLMSTSNRSFLHTEQSSPSPSLLPPWLSNSNCAPTASPSSPSVTLSLCPSTVAASPPIAWLHPERGPDNTNIFGACSLPPQASIPSTHGDNLLVTEMVECCRELEEGHRAWAAHKKEAAWRLRRVELQLESEKASRKRDKMEEIEAKVKALKEEQNVALDRIEAECRDQLAGLRKDAENKEQKLAEQWAAKHMRLSKFLEQLGSSRSRASDANCR